MSDIEEIKNKVNIEELVGEYVQLKPAGVNKKGLCPFHNEKTPSFVVNSERENWHCFGCGKGGDIFTFIEEMEGMEFREALKYLADKAGVQLSNTFKNEVSSSQKNRIKEINTEAARFFHNFLIKMDSSRSALDYLHDRGLTDETIEEWQIGFVPEQWDLLTQYLMKKGFGIEDLVAAGMTIQKERANAGSGKGFYDRFRGRIMFPIWNVHSEVVGFTGRLLVEKDNFGGKYVNTPQTLVYDKSNVIYGLNRAKKEIKSKDLVVMVEGQMDVIACHQAGMKNVVASSGTALTEKQIKLLKRYSGNISMSFDMDEAGQNAAKKGIEIAVSKGMSVKVIKIPEDKGKDPDECIKNNSQVWFGAVENSQNVMEWYFEKVMAGKDIKDPKQKQLVVNELLKEIILIPYAVEKDHWLKILSDNIEVDVSVLREELKGIKNDKIKVKSDDKTEMKKVIKIEKVKLDRLLERFFALLLKIPTFVTNLPDNFEKYLSTDIYKALYQGIKEGYNIDKLREVADFADQENLVDILTMKGEWEFSSVTEIENQKEIKQLIVLIAEEWLRQERKKLQIEIEQAEKEGDKEKLGQLLKEFQNL
jgi:DNA primase